MRSLYLISIARSAELVFRPEKEPMSGNETIARRLRDGTCSSVGT
jgi:hypothetical protein